MADEQLRRGERRWRATGSPEDEARHLRERLRAGRVDLVRLALAAECGHAAARAALGRRPGLAASAPLQQLAARAERAGDDEARVRAAVALAHALLEAAHGGAAPGQAAGPGDGPTRYVGVAPEGARLRALAEAALSSTEDWIRCPCPAHMLHALKAWRAVAPAGPASDPASPDIAAELLRRAVAALERRGLGARGVAHLRVTWLPWLIEAAAR